MDPTTINDIQFAEGLVRTGINDSVQRNNYIFNGLSINSLLLTSRFNPGDKARYSFWMDILGAKRQDPESDTDLSADNIIQKSMQNTILSYEEKQAMREVGVCNNINDYLGFVGKKLGDIINRRQVNDVLHATVGAIGSNSDEVLDKTEGPFNKDIIYDVMEDMEDSWENVKAIVMHPRVYAQLSRNQKDGHIYNMGGLYTVSGATTTMDLPIILKPSSALVEKDTDFSSHAIYKTFFLVENTAMVDIITEGGFDVSIQQCEIGRDDLGYDIQVNWTNKVYVKGYKWYSTKNPTDEDLKDNTNWIKVFNKDNVAGRMVKTIEG